MNKRGVGRVILYSDSGCNYKHKTGFELCSGYAWASAVDCEL